jgi:hypothetical protein
MDQLDIYPPPAAAHQDCSLCKAHHLTEEDQRRLNDHGADLAVVEMDDFQAQYLLTNLMSAEKKDIQHVRNMLQSHGEFIETRWRKITRTKRADLLTSASPGLFPVGACERLEQLGLWKRDTIGHVNMPWLEPDAFSKDRMKLIHLIHVRSEFDAARWAIFDTRSNWRVFTKSPYTYNPGAVIMHGEHYGKLVEFKVEEAHSWHQVGFPRAVLTFKTQ